MPLITSTPFASGSVGWDIPNAIYDSKTKNVSGDASAAIAGLAFKPDGLKMYLVDINTFSTVYQYTLSVAWDISTATYDSVSFGTSAIQASAIHFRDDGTKMYIVDEFSSDVIEHNLTAWDLSTASAGTTKSVASDVTNPRGVYLRPDGLMMWVQSANSPPSDQSTHEFTLSPAWDLSTASFSSDTLSIVPASTTSISDLTFSPDGLRIFNIVADTNTVYKNTLGTAWDITDSGATETFVLTQGISSDAVEFKPDGTKMYTVDNFDIYQYSVP